MGEFAVVVFEGRDDPLEIHANLDCRNPVGSGEVMAGEGLNTNLSPRAPSM
jgi:hypothetical protein